jgi:hypothetical protein
MIAVTTISSREPSWDSLKSLVSIENSLSTVHEDGVM